MFKDNGQDAVILTHNIDTSFISQLERRNEKYKFVRIDADITDVVTEEASEEELKSANEALSKLFKDSLGKENLDVKVEKFKNPETASMITLSEDGIRMEQMMKMYSMSGMPMGDLGAPETLVLNINNELVKYLMDNADGEHSKLFCEQLYDLARIANKPLSPDDMTKFITRSNTIMLTLAK